MVKGTLHGPQSAKQINGTTHRISASLSFTEPTATLSDSPQYALPAVLPPRRKRASSTGFCRLRGDEVAARRSHSTWPRCTGMQGQMWPCPWDTSPEKVSDSVHCAFGRWKGRTGGRERGGQESRSGAHGEDPLHAARFLPFSEAALTEG